MSEYVSVAVANAGLDAFETTIGTSPILRVRTGAKPAPPTSNASTGTVLVSMTLPSDYMSGAAGGSKAKLGTWTATATGAGVAGHYEITDSTGTTVHARGDIKQPVTIATNALTAANANVLNHAATTGVAVGDLVTGTGVLPNTYVLAFTGATVTLSRATTAGVANATNIKYGAEMEIDASSISSGQSVTVTTYTRTSNNI